MTCVAVLLCAGPTQARGQALPPVAKPLKAGFADSLHRRDAVGAPRDPARFATASRTTRPIILDGRADEAAWSDAMRIDAFRTFDPAEDGDPAFRTEARVLYDAQFLYVYVRAFDPSPDSIVGLLSRRDQRTPSDYVSVMIDSYHDRRTAFTFMTNPAAVQRDLYVYNDQVEDLSWDAVWDVRTSIDTLGWAAEFRIPLAQLRFPEREELTFGLMLSREVQRRGERSAWPVLRRSRVGLVSQFGEVDGFRNLRPPSRLEVRPYLVERNVSTVRPGVSAPTRGRAQERTAGLDVKYGIGANLTLDATVNPDFGQVEADPAVLNLSAFEQFFQERRPFFLEGAGTFAFEIDCNDGSCTGLFYPRRIGRSPQLAGVHGDESTPQFSTILGAAKLTGRSPNGLSIGLLDAVTGRVAGRENRTVEPQTNHVVARAVQEFRGGNSVLGVMGTSVNRQLDESSRPYLRSDAWSGGVDGRHRFADNRYEISGFLAASHVRGDSLAIALTQRSSVHGYTRPDGVLTLDESRTSLSGLAGSLRLSKVGGGRTRMALGYLGKGPGFEINDVGFLPRSDLHSQFAWFGIQQLQPGRWYRRLGLNFNQWGRWTTGGLPLSSGANVNANGQLHSFWNVWSGIGAQNLFPAYDDRAARGGPAVRLQPIVFGWAGFDTDARRALVPGANVDWHVADDGRSWAFSTGPRIQFRGASRVQGSVSMRSTKQRNDWQWVRNVGAAGAPGTAYTFARLDQTTHSLTARFDMTASPTLSLQLYAQPFVTVGQFSDWRELAQPRAPQYADRFQPYAGDPGGFNVKEFRSNLVARWEYRPGSTLFFVWQQGRFQNGIDAGDQNLRRDVSNLFGVAPNNTFLVKASYWFGR